MQIIRETTKGKSYCVVRSDNESCTAAHLALLVREAKADFPALKDDAINVVLYAAHHTFGIEFTPPGNVPNAYVEIEQLEATLN